MTPGSIPFDESAPVAAADASIASSELEVYIEELEAKLSTIGDDALLANLDLQDMLQKQQQTIEMIPPVARLGVHKVPA